MKEGNLMGEVAVHRQKSEMRSLESIMREKGKIAVSLKLDDGTLAAFSFTAKDLLKSKINRNLK
ncbi:hypothetical protein [Exiguobacterium sp. S22-S28]|uniref:hypothetical protein n=1 Tax=Exiguobacterium sp. S22-S28 TaxID=3342768 RepID=UPI00372D5480